MYETVDENFNCIKLTEEAKYKLKNILQPKQKKSITLLKEISDLSEKHWTDSPNIPKSDNPFKNIFQRVPQANEIQLRLAKIPVSKPKTSLKKSVKPKHIKYNSEKRVDFNKYAQLGLKFSIKMIVKTFKFITVYGTELIIQVMAVTVITIVLILKFLDRFISNRHLETCISYVENINLSALTLPQISFDHLFLYKLNCKLFWIIYKFIEFFSIILKHIVIQTILGIFFLISWSVYTMIQFISHTILFPTVDKTINVLKMDPDAIANLTKCQINRFLVFISYSSHEIAPITTQIIISISNLRYNIIQVNLIKRNLLSTYVSIKSFLQTILDLIKDCSDFVRMMLDLYETLIILVVLLCNTLSTIGWLIYCYFLLLQYAGYVIGIFMQVLISANSVLSKLQKI